MCGEAGGALLFTSSFEPGWNELATSGAFVPLLHEMTCDGLAGQVTSHVIRNACMGHQPTLCTKRLILRPFELSDAKAVQRLAGDRTIADTTLNIPHPYEDGAAEEWISTHKPKFESHELANFAITRRTNGELIGAVGLAIMPQFERAELGYWVGKPYWNKGYCTEASTAVVECAFTQLNINRVYAVHFKRNPASGEVMRKLGMKREGTLRQHAKKWDSYEDIVFYGLLRKDWLKKRGG